jgi:hypothetical protein
MIKRYELEFVAISGDEGFLDMAVNDYGQYVKYDDHLAALAERDKLVEEMIEFIEVIKEHANEERQISMYKKSKYLLARAEAIRGGKSQPDPVKAQMLEALEEAEVYIVSGIVDQDKIIKILDKIGKAIEAAEKEEL